jgi:hypothetical protein
MKPDEALQWVRDVRHTISHELGNDPRKFVEFHRGLREKYKRLSEPVRSPVPVPVPAHAGS